MKDSAFLPVEVATVLRELGQCIGTSSHSKARYQRAAHKAHKAHKALRKPQRRKQQKAQRQQRKRNRK